MYLHLNLPIPILVVEYSQTKKCRKHRIKIINAQTSDKEIQTNQSIVSRAAVQAK